MKKLFFTTALLLAIAQVPASAQSYDDVYDVYNPQYNQSTTNQSYSTQDPYYGNGTLIDYNDDDYYYTSYLNRFYNPCSGFGYFSNCYSDPYAWGWGNSWSRWNNPYGYTNGWGWSNSFISINLNPWGLFVNPWWNTFSYYNPWNSYSYGYGGYCGWGNSYVNNYYFGNTCGYGNGWYGNCYTGWGGYSGCYNNYYYSNYNNYNGNCWGGGSWGYQGGGSGWSGNNGGGHSGGTQHDAYHYGPRNSSYTFANLKEYKATREVVDRIKTGPGGTRLGGSSEQGGGRANAPSRWNVAPRMEDRVNTEPSNTNGGFKNRSSNNQPPRMAAPRNDAPRNVAPQEAPSYGGATNQGNRFRNNEPERQRFGGNAPSSNPRYTAPEPSREEPRYTAPEPRREEPRYEAPSPRREAPRYTPEPRREEPRYTAPEPSREQPRYEAPAPQREQPRYEAPHREAPRYEAPAPRYEAPHREAPRYEAPSNRGGGDAPSGGRSSFGRR